MILLQVCYQVFGVKATNTDCALKTLILHSWHSVVLLFPPPF